MVSNDNIIIIGAGIIGLTTAYALALNGAKNVIVIEKFNKPASFCSHANAGVVRDYNLSLKHHISNDKPLSILDPLKSLLPFYGLKHDSCVFMNRNVFLEINGLKWIGFRFTKSWNNIISNHKETIKECWQDKSFHYISKWNNIAKKNKSKYKDIAEYFHEYCYNAFSLNVNQLQNDQTTMEHGFKYYNGYTKIYRSQNNSYSHVDKLTSYNGDNPKQFIYDANHNDQITEVYPRSITSDCGYAAHLIWKKSIQLGVIFFHTF